MEKEEIKPDLKFYLFVVIQLTMDETTLNFFHLGQYKNKY